ncbi:HD domain-containing protein [archaeon]|nr:HD domain-containing protein [archaeon]
MERTYHPMQQHPNQQTAKRHYKLLAAIQLIEGEIPNNPYHNYRHTLDVYFQVSALASLEGLSPYSKFILQTAALLHDIIYVPGRKDNEEKSAEFARARLPRIGYSRKEIDKDANPPQYSSGEDIMRCGC